MFAGLHKTLCRDNCEANKVKTLSTHLAMENELHEALRWMAGYFTHH